MIRFLEIIRAEDHARANTDALLFDPVGGDRTFTVPLSTNEAGSPTHYWTSGVVTDDQYMIIQTLQSGYVGSTLVRWDIEDDPHLPARLLRDLSLRVVGPQREIHSIN